MVRHGVPEEKILEVAQEEQADLVILGLRSVKGLVRATHLPTAVAHQVISHATCPVLTIGSCGQFTSSSCDSQHRSATVPGCNPGCYYDLRAIFI
jgi:Universal stress protein family